MRHLLVIAALVLLFGCGGPPAEPADCRKADLATYAATMKTQIVTFQQQAELAAATPRASMGTPLQRLLDIQTETRKIAAPGCAADYQAAVLAAMDQHQQALQAFASQAADNATVGTLLDQGRRNLVARAADLDLIATGVVPAFPTPTP